MWFARCGLANVQARGELTEAETLYRQTIADFPGDVVARNGLANVLQARGELTEAETLYRQTIANFPGDVVARCGLANVLQARGELTEAETLYRQTIADFPGDVVARNGLANICRKSGRLEEAKQLLRDSPKKNDIYDEVLWALIEATEQQFQQALNRLEAIARTALTWAERDKLQKLTISVQLRAHKYQQAKQAADELLARVGAKDCSACLLHLHARLLTEQAFVPQAPANMLLAEQRYFEKLRGYANNPQALATNDDLYESAYDMLLAA